MEEIHKNKQLFADRFKGRANKIDKKGLSFALENPTQSSILIEMPMQHKKKLVSLGPKAEMIRNQVAKRKDSNPESRRQSPKLPKISTNQQLSSINKIEPGSISPMRHNRQAMPPSRSISDITPGMHKRHFGKYLQLNEEGLKHFQLLLQYQQRGRSNGDMSLSHLQ